MITNVWYQTFTQLTATASAMMLVLEAGITDGWQSPNIARMTTGNATISLTSSEASWLASSLKLGRFVSVAISMILVEVAGSKRATLCSFIPISLSWALSMAANSAMWLYVARFFSGITVGLTFGLSSIYLSEVATPSLRGTFISVSRVGWPLGILLGTIGETYLPMEVTSGIYLVPCIVGILLFVWLPESAYQLVKNKQIDKARESLAWYRGNVNIDAEMQEIIEFVEATGRLTITEKMQQLKSTPVLKSLILVSGLFAFLQLSGGYILLFYMETILENGQSYIVSPNKMVIYINVIMLVYAIVGVNIIDRLGRRILLATSMSLMAAGLLGLGLHYYLLDNTNIDPKSIEVLPVISTIIAVTTFSGSLAPTAGTLISEMFPAGVRSIAITMIIFVGAFLGFATAKAYQPLIDAIGEAYVFWMFSGFVASAIPFVLFLLPETKGKSLQEIQNILCKK